MLIIFFGDNACDKEIGSRFVPHKLSQCLERTFISNVNVFGRLLQATCRALNVIKILCLYYKLIKTVCYAGPSFLRDVCNYVFTTGQSFVVCAELSETASKSIRRSLSIWLSIYLSYRYALDLWGVFPGVTYRHETSPNVGLLLDRRHRPWANFKPILAQRLVFPGVASRPRPFWWIIDCVNLTG